MTLSATSTAFGFLRSSAIERLPRPSASPKAPPMSEAERGAVDADHVGAHVREEHPAVRARRQAGEVENPDAFQWSGHGTGV